MKDTATYTGSGSLLFEPSGQEVRAVAEGMRGRVRETAATTLTLREAEKSPARADAYHPLPAPH